MKNYISNLIGYRTSKVTVISSIVISIIILFYPLSMGSYLEPDVYRFEDRTTFHQYFRGNYIFNQLIDNLIMSFGFLGWCAISFNDKRTGVLAVLFLGLLLIISLSTANSIILQVLSILSLPVISSIYIINRKISNRLLRPGSGLLTLNYFLISFLILELASIFASIYNSDINGPFIDIMILISRFAPALMLLIIFIALVRLITNQEVLTTPSMRKLAASFLIRPFGVQDYQNPSRTKNMVFLSTFMALSIIIVLIPHIGGQLYKVGEDTTPYSEMMQELKSSRNTEHFVELIFSGIMSGDRPLSLTVMYVLLTLFSNNVVLAFEIVLPAILAPLLVLSTYLLSKALSGSSLVSICSSFITAVSFQLMIGVYGGLYANWIALVIGTFAVWLAVRYLDTGGKKFLVAFSVIMLALLLSHSYTWTIFTAFLILFLLVLRWKKVSGSKQVRDLLIIIACIIAIDFIKGIALESLSAVQLNISVAESHEVGLVSPFGDRWSVLVRTVEVFLGGIFSNMVILLLVLYFTVMFKIKNKVGYFTTVFLSLGMIAIIFGDKIVQSRILYDIPFQIPAGLALANIFVLRHGKVAAMVIGLSLLSIAIYTMTNLGVSPR
jgi:hypothetical protein